MRSWCIFLAVVLVCLLSYSRGSCVSADVAVQTAEVQGYTEINVTNHAWFAVGWRGCSSSDAARFTVRAKNPVGKVVEVYVCSGWLLKSATIRVP